MTEEIKDAGELIDLAARRAPKEELPYGMPEHLMHTTDLMVAMTLSAGGNPRQVTIGAVYGAAAFGEEVGVPVEELVEMLRKAYADVVRYHAAQDKE